MAKADKAGEPSMDEILASIRKIIAEEPVGPRKTGVPEPAMAEAAVARTAVVQGTGADEGRAKADMPTRQDPLAAPAGRQRDDGPSWMRPTAPREQVAADSKPTAAREPLKPFFPEPGRAPPAAGDATPQQAVDFGAIVPRRPPDGTIELPGHPPSERRPQSGRLPEWLARSAPSAAQPGRNAGPLPPPAEPTRFPSRDAMTVGAALSELSPLRGNGASSLPPPPGVATEPTAAASRNQQPASGDTARTPVGAGVAEWAAGKAEPASVQGPAIRSETEEAPPVAGKAAAPSVPVAAQTVPGRSPGDAQTAAASGPGDTAAKPSAGAATNGFAETADVAVHSTIPADGSAPRSNAALPVAEPAPAISKPAALGERGRPARPGAMADLIPAATAASGVRTLEDTVVDLLRPMIRQWLDDNMPRMVEKALRIELAQSVKPKAEPPKH